MTRKTDQHKQVDERTEIVGYARLSMQGEDHTSIDRQVALGNDFAKKAGLHITWFVEPEGHRSGRSEKNRPKWLELKAYLATHGSRVRFVWAQDSDRVSRHVVTRLTFFEALKMAGINYVSHLEPHLSFDSNLPEADRVLVGAVLAGVSQHLADWTGTKIRNHIAFVTSKGGMWGYAPRGLRVAGKGTERNFVKDETQGDVLKTMEAILRIYVAENIGYGAVAVRARADGLKLPDRPRRDDKGVTQNGALHPVKLGDVDRLIRLQLHHYDGVMDSSLMAQVYARRDARSNHKLNGRKIRHDRPMLYRLIFCIHCGARFWTSCSQPQEYMRADTYRRKTKTGKIAVYTSRGIRTQWPSMRHPDSITGCQLQHRCIAIAKYEKQVWDDLARYFVLSDEQRALIVKLAGTKDDQSHTLRRKALEKKLANLEEMFIDPDNAGGAMLSKKRYLELRAEINQQLDVLPHGVVATAEVNERLAFERLSAVAALLRDRSNVTSGQINDVMSSIFEQILVDGHKITRYKPREWCAELFPANLR